jgi:hypothetical protein
MKLEKVAQRPHTDKSMKKWVEADCFGKSYSSMVVILHTDLWAFSKEMDPFLNWDKQPQDTRDRLEEWLYKEYDVTRNAEQINKKYLKSKVGGAFT